MAAVVDLDGAAATAKNLIRCHNYIQRWSKIRGEFLVFASALPFSAAERIGRGEARPRRGRAFEARLADREP